MSGGAHRTIWLFAAPLAMAVTLSGCAREQAISTEVSGSLDVEYDGSDLYFPHATVCADLAAEAAGWSVRDGIVAEVSEGETGVGISFDGVLREATGAVDYEWSCELRIAEDEGSLTATLTRFDRR